MLSEVKGLKLDTDGANEWWGSIFGCGNVGVLQYYDGPRLIMEKRSDGSYVLAWWREDDEENLSIARWLYVPTTETNIRIYLQGEITSLDFMFMPREEFVFVVDLDYENDKVVSVVMLEPIDVPKKLLLSDQQENRESLWGEIPENIDELLERK